MRVSEAYYVVIHTILKDGREVGLGGEGVGLGMIIAIYLLSFINKGSRGRVARQRSAKPCTPVRMWSRPLKPPSYEGGFFRYYQIRASAASATVVAVPSLCLPSATEVAVPSLECPFRTFILP